MNGVRNNGVDDGREDVCKKPASGISVCLGLFTGSLTASLATESYGGKLWGGRFRYNQIRDVLSGRSCLPVNWRGLRCTAYDHLISSHLIVCLTRGSS